MKNLLTLLFKAPVKAYQYLISPLLGPRCRFYPTCSDYCLQALEKHGALRGAWLTFKRLSRCHPWSKHQGHDPVPEIKNTTK
jgi:putative membrane protein insertion efficiency factor